MLANVVVKMFEKKGLPIYFNNAYKVARESVLTRDERQKKMWRVPSHWLPADGSDEENEVRSNAAMLDTTHEGGLVQYVAEEVCKNLLCSKLYRP